MFSLTIVFGPSPMVWTLMFKERLAAEIAFKFLQADEGPIKVGPHDKSGIDQIKLTDEFGQECLLKRSQIHGTMLEDLEQSKLAHIERALHQARTKVKADELAQADPVIRSAAMRQGGAILQPAMPGMPFQNGRMPS